MSDESLSLGGKTWALPKLAPKQNRIVVPLAMEYIPRIADAYKAARIDPEDEAKGYRRIDLIKPFADPKSQDELGTMVFTALTRGSPQFTREEFDELPINLEDLLGVAAQVARACGVMR